MLITTEGTVVHVTDVGDNDRIIKVLSAEMGLIDITAKGAKKQSSSANSSTQLFVCAKFCFNERNGRYYLNSCEPVKTFYGLRTDMQRLALASYLADIVRFVVTEKQSANDVYRLYMNSLYMISEKSADTEFIRFIFELRITADLGMMPDLIGCSECFTNEGELFFMIKEGIVLCGSHLRQRMCHESMYNVSISSGMLEAMRFVCLSDLDRIFNFRLSEDALKTLVYISEQYCIEQLDKFFPTLQFYKQITKELKKIQTEEIKNE